MPTSRQGSIHLFRFADIDVFLHWSWFLVALFEINSRAGKYSSVTWNVMEYLALFLIVLCHEYGHALACRQVGGRANQIVLWPLGGVAYVDPPPRPGAMLWSIAAGPLVNVALFPVLLGLLTVSRASGWRQTMPDVYRLVLAVGVINVGLLIFNLLPIYPLDGGQIVRSLLWFVLGRARSLMVATLIGFVGVAGLIVLALRIGSAVSAAGSPPLTCRAFPNATACSTAGRRRSCSASCSRSGPVTDQVVSPEWRTTSSTRRRQA